MGMRRRLGFTLIELMVALVILAIIVAVAYPSYVDQVRKSRRAEAKAALLEDAQFMERNYTTSGQYSQDSSGSAITRCDLPEQYTPESANIKGSANCGSFDGSGAYYKFAFPASSQSNPGPSAFVLEAEPLNTQSDDKCGTLTIDNVGNKTCSTISKPTACLQQCWQ